MRACMRYNAGRVSLLGALGAALALVLACVLPRPAAAAPAHGASPPPASAYTVHRACPPPAPGHASCNALALLARTAAARAYSTRIGLAASTAVTPVARRASDSCETAPSAAAGCFGLTPSELHSAYDLADEPSGEQTVALVDAYNDPEAEADLETFDNEYGLPACTHVEGCFEQVNEHGKGETSKLPFPKTVEELDAAREGDSEEAAEAEEAEGWSIEISLDIETTRAICQSCHILLVEAGSTSYADLESAERTAASLHANEISNSWGGPECIQAAVRECVSDSSAFEDPGTVITASAGDSGYLEWFGDDSGFVGFPASSPHVVAVGGTRLELSPDGAWSNETVWNDGGESHGELDGWGATGGGCSVQFEAQPWQQEASDWSSVGCGTYRAVADVAADADPYTGLAVYDSLTEKCEIAFEEEGAGGVQTERVVNWCTIGGTSLASPLIASVFALAGGAHGVAYPARTLYENEVSSPSSLHDVKGGSNGRCDEPFVEPPGELGHSGCTSEEEAHSCSGRLICKAANGYDGPTGVGTPDGLAAFEPTGKGEGGGPPHEGGDGEEGSKDGGGGGDSGSSTGTGAEAPGAGASTPLASTSAALLSHLALTLGALVALDTSPARMHQVAFTFIATRATKVSVSLQKRVSSHGHTRWHSLLRAFELLAASGRNTERLPGRAALTGGTYRLTLTGAQGAGSEVLVFHLG